MRIKKKKTLYLLTLGCNKNQTDSEFLIAGLSKYFEITNNLKNAEIIIISPCAFLEIARVEAKEYIEKLIEFKKQNCKCLVVTGCYAELLKDEIFGEWKKKVDLVISLTDVETFAKAILDFFDKNIKYKFIQSNGNIFGIFDDKKINRIISHPNYAYLKISEGCNNRCSYCLIPSIRGNFRSRKQDIILAETEYLLKNDVKELNIISQDIGSYGTDFAEKNKTSFIDLLKKVSKIKVSHKKQHYWTRLLYLHPKNTTKELIKVIKNNENICHYIDMPLQHINDNILSKMNRKTTKNEIIEKIEMLKAEIPDICIRTTFIVGFPSETEKNFEELLEFVGKKYFDRIGVFAYSNEKGTVSYNFENQISENIKQKRLKNIMKLQKKISLEKNKKIVDEQKIYTCLAEEIIDNKTLKARIYSMAPEVDGYVFIKYDKPQNFFEKFTNESKFFKIKLTKFNEYDLFGEEIIV